MNSLNTETNVSKVSNREGLFKSADLQCNLYNSLPHVSTHICQVYSKYIACVKIMMMATYQFISMLVIRLLHYQ